MIVRELITRLGFDSKQAEGAAKRYDKVVGGLRRNLLRLAAVAAGFVSGGVLFKFVLGTEQAASAADDLGQTVGITAEKIQGLMFASERMGVSTQLTESALRAFARRIGAADQDYGPAVNAVERLNLQLRDADGNMRSTMDLFFEVANGIKALNSEAAQIELADQFFSETGRPLSLLLREGEDGIRRLMERHRELGGVISNFNVKVAAKFGDVLQDFKVVMSGLRFTIGTELIPHMTELLQKFVEWFVINKDIINQNIADFIRGLVFTLRLLGFMLGQVVDGINAVADAMGGWSRVLRFLLAAFVAGTLRKFLGFIIRIAPLVVGALTNIRKAAALLLLLLRRFPGVILILAVEDFISFLQGAPSIIGKVVDAVEGWKDAIIQWLKDVRQAITEWWADSAVGKFFNFIAEGVGNIREFGHSLGLGLNQPPSFGLGMPRSFNLNINENVEVNVPPGTPQEQAVEIERQVRGHVRNELDRSIRGAINQEPAF